MKLSNKGCYALQALFDLAFHAEGEAAQVKDICQRQAIPARFLEQVFQDLKRAGLVSSRRGPRGGYRLACRPEEIRLGDVLRAIEGPVQLCMPEPKRRVARQPTSHAVTRTVLSELGAQIEGCFDAVTLSDLCERADSLGIHKGPPAGYSYVI